MTVNFVLHLINRRMRIIIKVFLSTVSFTGLVANKSAAFYDAFDDIITFFLAHENLDDGVHVFINFIIHLKNLI